MVVAGFMLGIDTLSMWAGGRGVELPDFTYAVASIILLSGGIKLVSKPKPSG